MFTNVVYSFFSRHTNFSLGDVAMDSTATGLLFFSSVAINSFNETAGVFTILLLDLMQMRFNCDIHVLYIIIIITTGIFQQKNKLS